VNGYRPVKLRKGGCSGSTRFVASTYWRFRLGPGSRQHSACWLLGLAGCNGILGLDRIELQRAAGTSGASTLGSVSGGGTTETKSDSRGGQTGLGGTSGPSAMAGTTRSSGGASSALPALDTTLGAVFITTPERTCTGTLMTNGWVLTANTCLNCNRDAKDIAVQYGTQLRSVALVARYTDTDCSLGGLPSGRDVMLLRLKEPMLVGGVPYGYFQTPTHFATTSLDSRAQNCKFTTLKCAGWDMSPGRTTPWLQPLLQSSELPNLGIQVDPGGDPTSRGDQMWVGNSSPSDPKLGLLPTVNDIGSACWMTFDKRDYLAGVNAGGPVLGRAFAPGSNLESRYSAFTDAKIQQFYWNTLSGVIDLDGFALGSPIAAAVVSPTITDYFWISEAGQLQIRRRENDGMNAASAIALAPGAAPLLIEQPGVFAVDKDKIWLMVRDSGGKLWGRRRDDETWQSWRWIEAPALSYGVSGGLFSDGTLYVVGVTSNKTLKYATLDPDGNSLAAWADVPMPNGAPSWTSRPTVVAFDIDHIVHSSIDVHLMGSDGCIWATARQLIGTNSVWVTPFCMMTGAAGQPASGQWGGNRMDVFYWTPGGQLVRSFLDNWLWASETTVFSGQLDPTWASQTLTVPFAGSYELAWRVGASKLRILRYPY